MKINKIALILTLAAGTILTSCSNFEPTVYETDLVESVDGEARNILSKMTLEEKVGQILQADISAITPQQAKDYNIGSVLNGGNSAPGGGKIAKPEAWVALADAFWEASTDTSDGGVGIPLLWGTDAVHGHNNIQTATIFPHNIGLGAANDPKLIKEIGDVTAREIRATGIDWTFAPTLAVARDDRWGRAYESYSERPEIVAKYAKAMVIGLQGEAGSKDFLVGDNVIATAKHFIGDGGTQYGVDKGDTIGTEDEIFNIHAAGYQPAFDAGVQTVMSSFSSVNGAKMHGSKHLLTDVLRGKMGFDGFVVGDWNGHAEIPGCTATDCPEALMAGIDMYMAPDSWRGLYDSLLEQAKTGDIPLERLDEATLRILKVKIRSGLFEAGRPSSRASAQADLLGSTEHSDVARRAVRQSLVLLKNENKVLPLRGAPNVLVTGSGANSMQQQTGGWTLNWQGTGNPNEIFERGETVYSGLKTALEAQGGTALLSETGSYLAKPDAAIVVFGEQPYAEFFGDTSDLVYEFSDGENLKILKTLQSQGIPVISVFLTGRPLWVNPHINASEAFVAAWLPGTEAGGIADVIVADKDGNARHDFTGRLSFSWPADGAGAPINANTDEGILFPYGYGLSYGDEKTLATLSEDSGLAYQSNAFDGNIVTRGGAAKAFSLWLGDSSNANTPIASLKGSSLGGLIQTRGVDYKAQEDARQITWTGQGSLSIRSPRPIDMSQTKANVLSLTWRIDERPQSSLSVEIDCGQGCTNAVDISSVTAQLPMGEWIETDLALDCFVASGHTLTVVDTPLKITSEAAARITLHEVTLKTSSEPMPSCPAQN